MMSVTTIPTDEIRFHPTSFCDRDGRVFWWRNHLYRGIAAQYAPLCQQLFDTGLVQALVEQGFLVKTVLTELTLPGYALVLKHQRIPFVSYANEWCPEMLRDAGQFTLDMMQALAPYQLTVDVGTWDILYDGCCPRYVDFCSIATVTAYDHNSWHGVRDDFYSYFLNPLRLMSQGYGNLARHLLTDYEHNEIPSELAALMGQRIYGAREGLPKRVSPLLLERFRQNLFYFKKRGLKRVSNLNSKLASRHDPCRLDLVSDLQRALTSIQLTAMPTTGTTGTALVNSPAANRHATQNHAKTFTESDRQQQKHVRQVLSTLQPTTVLDVGCGTGRYARLAASLGARVVAVDRDDRQIACCYHQAKAAQLPILPLVMDIRYPSPGQGTDNALLAPATERLSCELVLALGILDQLVIEQYLTLTQGVKALKAFAKRWLLVEFSTALNHSPKGRPDYTLNALLDLLDMHFSQVKIVSIDDTTAPLILCEK